MLVPEYGSLGPFDPVVRFTVPPTGTYDIDYSVARLSQYAGSDTIALEVNGVVIDSSSPTSNGYMYTQRPEFDLPLNAGDFVDFEVSAVSFPGGDSNGLRGT